MNVENLAKTLQKPMTTNNRIIIAIAGPPASGKSTFAQELCDVINSQRDQMCCIIVPMDGFHLDNATLDKRGLRCRKGAPQTFDINGFINLVTFIRSRNEDVHIPEFDRELDVVVMHNKMVTCEHNIILLEGNYLLSRDEPWVQLEPLLDYTIFLKTRFEELKRRLLDRWLSYGYTQTEAEMRAMSNDIPNAHYVFDQSRNADLTLT